MGISIACGEVHLRRRGHDMGAFLAAGRCLRAAAGGGALWGRALALAQAARKQAVKLLLLSRTLVASAELRPISGARRHPDLLAAPARARCLLKMQTGCG